MTAAVCVHCGAMKSGGFIPCPSCEFQPVTETDLAYSLALTDHYFSLDVLRQISNEMRQGAPRPSLPRHQEDEMRKEVRAYLENFGEVLGLPPPSDPVFRRRSAKFNGWDKSVIRNSPFSSLRWRAGFGWIAVTLFVIPSVAAIFLTGTLRIAAVAAATAVLLFNLYRWWKWNKQGWPRLHHRAMLVYAQIAGLELGRAERDGREFSRVDACRKLALAMVLGNWRDASVEAMINSLVKDQGGYLAGIMSRFSKKVMPNLDDETLASAEHLLRHIEFGPQLVIANIIENTFGGEEAARYAIAIVRRRIR